jgi:lipopolysaccharide transport system ATP-binding protein
MAESGAIIQVENLGKKYVLRHAARQNSGNLREALTNRLRALGRRLRRPWQAPPRETREEFWALKDVSFEVQRGETLGVVGRNGAGKSTLLKVLSRITDPTTGRVTLDGRAASLLEVGTGFHPELTGRENIYLNGAVLGMTRGEIRRKFDEIVAFAEVEKFIDTPVKRYSSGMYMRLAFAVAAHLEPEILVVDEVLAVGDAEFQRKCLGRMQEVAQTGRTVLFVSHNMVAVQRLCQQALWLENGRIKYHGDAASVVHQYMASGDQGTMEGFWPRFEEAPGTQMIRLRRASARSLGNGEGKIAMDTPLAIEIEFWNKFTQPDLNVVLHFINAEEIIAFGSSSGEYLESRPLAPGLFRATCHIPGNLLNEGQLRLNLFFVRNGSNLEYRHDNLLSFPILDSRGAGMSWHGKRVGVVRPQFEWALEPIDPPPERKEQT